MNWRSVALKLVCFVVILVAKMSTVGVVNAGKHGAAESIMMLLHVGGEKLGKLKISVEEWLKEKRKSIYFLMFP